MRSRVALALLLAWPIAATAQTPFDAGASNSTEFDASASKTFDAGASNSTEHDAAAQKSFDAAASNSIQWRAWQPEARPFDAARARRLYDDKCRLCHGVAGRGDGAAAQYLVPRPRDFSRGIFRYRSTPSGEPPTLEDLFHSITRGLGGSSMPSWSGLSVEDRWLLAGEVARRAVWPHAASPSRVLVVGAPPTPTRERLDDGAAVWRRAGCAQCHGEGARGDGPAVETLVDDAGRPLRPFDLARAEDYRGGCRAEDIFRTVATGLDGSAMPSFAEALTRDALWDVALWLRSRFIDPSRCRD